MTVIDESTTIDSVILQVFRLKKSVESEMRERGAEGQLWSNDQCKDWIAYQEAESTLRTVIHRRYEELEAHCENHHFYQSDCELCADAAGHARGPLTMSPDGTQMGRWVQGFPDDTEGKSDG